MTYLYKHHSAWCSTFYRNLKYTQQKWKGCCYLCCHLCFIVGNLQVITQLYIYFINHAFSVRVGMNFI